MRIELTLSCIRNRRIPSFLQPGDGRAWENRTPERRVKTFRLSTKRTLQDGVDGENQTPAVWVEARGTITMQHPHASEWQESNLRYFWPQTRRHTIRRHSVVGTLCQLSYVTLGVARGLEPLSSPWSYGESNADGLSARQVHCHCAIAPRFICAPVGYRTPSPDLGNPGLSFSKSICVHVTGIEPVLLHRVMMAHSQLARHA